MDNIKEWTSLPIPELLTRVSCRKRLEEDLCCRPSRPPDDVIGEGTELNFKE